MKLKKYKLRKLCLPNQIGKYGIPAPAIAYSNGKIRYLRISDISEEGTLVNTDKKSVESDDIEQYILEENDIVFARTGNSTGRAYLYDKRDGVMAYAGFLIKYQLDEHKVNPIYLRYFTLSTFYKQWVANLSVGSTRGNISAQTFADCPIVLPPRHQQDVLVETLSNIDAKIKLNRQINDNLEAVAKQLYDYWFVQFDFPNEEGKPYKSSGGVMVWNEKLKREIPKGWHCGTLLDIAEYTNGLACQKYRPTDDNKLPVIKIKEMHDGLSVDTEWVKADIPDEVKVFDGDVLFSWSASLEVMLWAYGNGGLNQHIFKVTSKNGYPRSFYFYQLIHYIGVFKQMAEARKTTMGHITQDHLRQSSIVLPPDVNIANKLEEKLCPIFDAIVKNSQEIMTLTKQRDELLPLLMNGQASVNYHLSVLFITKIMLYYKETNINFEYERNNNTKRFRWNESGSVS